MAAIAGEGNALEAGGNAPPEGPEPLDAMFRPVAGDDRAIDGADRDAGDPLRLDTMLGKRLVGAGLIGAERPTALQNEDGLVAIGPGF